MNEVLLQIEFRNGNTKEITQEKQTVLKSSTPKQLLEMMLSEQYEFEDEEDGLFDRVMQSCIFTLNGSVINKDKKLEHLLAKDEDVLKMDIPKLRMEKKKKKAKIAKQVDYEQVQGGDESDDSKAHK